MYDTGIAELGRALSAMCPLGIREMGKGLWYEAQYQKGYHDWSRMLFGRSAPIALMWHEQVRGRPKSPADDIATIVTAIAAQNYTTYDAVMTERGRKRNVVTARYLAIREVKRRYPTMSYPQLGRIFGRDHTSIMYALGAGKRRTNLLDQLAAAE